jgi:hypothetical protein
MTMEKASTMECGELPGITCGELPGITCGELPGITCGELPGITWESFTDVSSAPNEPRATEPEMTRPDAAKKSAKVAIRAAVVFLIAITS